jgi:hypothetical protein
MNPFDPVNNQYTPQQCLFFAMFAGAVVLNVWYLSNARKRTIKFTRAQERKPEIPSPPPLPRSGEIWSSQYQAWMTPEALKTLDAGAQQLAVMLTEVAQPEGDPDFKRLLNATSLE